MTAFTTRPEILGTFGVVTSTHWIASAVGMSILEKAATPSMRQWRRASCCRSSSRIFAAPAATCRR
ncbi:hypothetical protein ACOJBO_22790 [Rhizobium beringeri]